VLTKSVGNWFDATGKFYQEVFLEDLRLLVKKFGLSVTKRD